MNPFDPLDFIDLVDVGMLAFITAIVWIYSPDT